MYQLLVGNTEDHLVDKEREVDEECRLVDSEEQQQGECETSVFVMCVWCVCVCVCSCNVSVYDSS